MIGPPEGSNFFYFVPVPLPIQVITYTLSKIIDSTQNPRNDNIYIRKYPNRKQIVHSN